MGNGNDGGAHHGQHGDIMYAMSISHHNGAPGVAGYRAIHCAECIAPKKHCYKADSMNGCASGYEAVYTGFQFGQYYGHQHPTERICIDEKGDWPNGNTGHYMYITKIWEGYEGRGH